MATTEMVQIDRSLIFSRPTTPRASPSLLSESHVLSPVAKAPTIEDLNQLNKKLTEIQLSSEDESKDDNPTEDFDSETHGSGGDAANRDLLGFDKAGWKPLWEAAIPYEPHRDAHATVSGLPLLRRGGGVPILLEIPLDRDASFRPFRDTSSDDAKKTPSTTVDGKAHGSGDDTVRELPVFHRDGWDPMGHDFSNHVVLPLYMYYDEPRNAALTKRTSHL